MHVPKYPRRWVLLLGSIFEMHEGGFSDELSRTKWIINRVPSHGLPWWCGSIRKEKLLPSYRKENIILGRLTDRTKSAPRWFQPPQVAHVCKVSMQSSMFGPKKRGKYIVRRCHNCSLEKQWAYLHPSSVFSRASCLHAPVYSIAFPSWCNISYLTRKRDYVISKHTIKWHSIKLTQREGCGMGRIKRHKCTARYYNTQNTWLETIWSGHLKSDQRNWKWCLNRRDVLFLLIVYESKRRDGRPLNPLIR